MKRRFAIGDALVPVDPINAFGKDGELAVPETEDFLPQHNILCQEILNAGCPVINVHDKHPKVSKHFKKYGGSWDEHAIEGTPSAEFLPGYYIDARMQNVPKGTTGLDDGYSGFDGTPLHEILQEQGVNRIYVTGVATNFCVKATALDGIKLGYTVVVLIDLIRAIEIEPGSEGLALKAMQNAGVILMESTDIPIVSDQV